MLRQKLREAQELVRSDAARYIYYHELDSSRHATAFEMFVLRAGFQASTVYRYGHALVQAQRVSTSRWARPFYLLGVAAFSVIERFSVAHNGIGVHRDAQIGPGVYFAHSGGTVLGPVIIGANCDIGQGVTLGHGQTAKDGVVRRGVPTLGDRVWIGPHAVVIGPIALGDDSAVGANALVVRDVPPATMVVGNPARGTSGNGSEGFIDYPGREAEERARAAAASTPDVDDPAGPATA